MSTGDTRLGLKTIDFSKWVSNTIDFLAPVGVIYLGFVATQIADAGFVLQDFVPSNFVLGAMVLYIINVVLDFLRKRAKAQ